MPELSERPGVGAEVPRTSPEELDRILREQQIEQGWWRDQSAMETVEDITTEVESGRAVIVPNEGEGYRISDNVKPEFRVLEKNTYHLLKSVVKQWLETVEGRGINRMNVSLIISSLARTQEYQQQLRDRGLPAAENSTHVKLGAFDIGIKWLELNRPELLEVLTDILEELHNKGEINFIKEPEIGAHHIAFNKTKIN